MVPTLANIFGLVPLETNQWLYTLGISILPIIIIEAQKMLDSRLKNNSAVKIFKERKTIC